MDAKKQFALCAYAAGLSRGRADELYYVEYPEPIYDRGTKILAVGVGGPSEFTKLRSEKKFEDAEELIRKLLNYKPYPHESVIEHGTVSFLFRCSRIATHEIVRHRLCAFTQTSTRYIEESDVITFILPPHMDMKDCRYWDDSLQGPEWMYAAKQAVLAYRKLRDSGVKRESARYLLPHCLSCWIQVTTNFRQWRHMIRLRTSSKAAPEMQRLFGMVKVELHNISPVLTEDLLT